tara:strand:+ start:3550 stop:3804 length:255 start_codon:yes stop_codon:yes gene_type:complete
MKIGDIVEHKSILGFKGILLEQMYTLPDTLDQIQLSLYPRDDWSYWKVLWFQHPFETIPQVQGAMERELIKPQKKNKKNKDNGL